MKLLAASGSLAREAFARGRDAGAALRALMLIGVCLLVLPGCLRFGYKERPRPAADGGTHERPDASSPDAATLDAGAKPDAASMPDAEATPDAASMPDSATPVTDAAVDAGPADPMPDAAMPDAAGTTPDAAVEPDAAMLNDAGPSCTPSAARDYCTQLPALPQAAQLDGVLDCGPSLVDLPAVGWNSTQTMPTDNHARYAAAWRPDGLYFYVEVDDPLRLPALASDVDPWCGDGVELYADSDGTYVSQPDYDYPGAIQLLAAAPARDASTQLAVDARYHTRSQSRISDWSVTRHVVVPRANGYALEAFVAAADLDLTTWQLASGGKVGFDIAINVSIASETATKVGCGYYLGQYYLHVSRTPCNADNCRPYTNAASFCTASLE